MTIITLPPELEATLTEVAKRQGTSPELLAIESLQRQFAPQTASVGTKNGAHEENLYDFLKDYIGKIDGTSEPLSEDTGRRVRELLKC